jgi:hypothetical protein
VRQIKDIIFCKYPEHPEHEKRTSFAMNYYLCNETKIHEINQQIATLTNAKLNLAENINKMKQKWEDGNE